VRKSVSAASKSATTRGLAARRERSGVRFRGLAANEYAACTLGAEIEMPAGNIANRRDAAGIRHCLTYDDRFEGFRLTVLDAQRLSCLITQ
jgi:hypothetical protein